MNERKLHRPKTVYRGVADWIWRIIRRRCAISAVSLYSVLVAGSHLLFAQIECRLTCFARERRRSHSVCRTGTTAFVIPLARVPRYVCPGSSLDPRRRIDAGLLWLADWVRFGADDRNRYWALGDRKTQHTVRRANYYTNRCRLFDGNSRRLPPTCPPHCVFLFHAKSFTVGCRIDYDALMTASRTMKLFLCFSFLSVILTRLHINMFWRCPAEEL